MNNKKFDYDFVVIGSGPGGYVCAIRAAQIGLKVAIIEAEHIGGICLNWGCIPTKALLKSAEVFQTIQNSESYGIKTEKVMLDFKAVIQRSRAVSEKLSKGVSMLLKQNKIEVIKGFGELVDCNTIEVRDGNSSAKVLKSLSAGYIVLATGARARQIPGFTSDGKVVWTYKEAMFPPNMVQPKRVCVVGGGAIGVEFANFYQNIGSSVTLLEVQDRIIPTEDADISKIMLKYLKNSGMQIETGIKLESIAKQSNACTVSYSGKKNVFDVLIMAVGVVPNTENIGLEKVGIETEKSGHVKVGKYLQTNVKNVFAIGDIVEGPWLAHKASHEGNIAAEMAGKLAGVLPESYRVHSLDREAIPACIYTSPQVASIGLTEEKALEKGIKIKVGKFNQMGNGKSIAAGATDGLFKVIFQEKTGEIIGAHLCGDGVTELISNFALAKSSELTEVDLIETVFPHPTISEMLHESVLDAFQRCIHM